MDLDRTLIDIIPKKDYDDDLSSLYKMILNSKHKDLKELTFNEMRFMIAIRKDAKMFI